MGWSEKYKKSIDCSNPKGFSQKAHCAGKKKNKNEMNENLKEVIMEILTEGVDDPGILKCVFMAGGPGSGKSYTAKELFGVGKGLTQSFSASGLKIVNSDTAFEKGMKDNGINPKDLAKIEKEDPELWDKITGKDSIRTRAKALTQKQQSFYEAGRLGMIIDGTGDEVAKIKKKKQHAEALGYDCYMVFVNTSLEVALERNANRDRTLPDDLVTDIWKACQNNLGKFQSIFSGNMVIVDNTVYKPINKNVQKAIDSFIRKPIYNRIGQKWIKTARALKKARLIRAGKEVNGTSLTEGKYFIAYKNNEGTSGVLADRFNLYEDARRELGNSNGSNGLRFWVSDKNGNEIKESLEERINLFVEENEPTNPDLWDRAIAAAKDKYEIYPSAYANAFASKWYGEKGGKWRTKKD
jgi:predicted kinase